MANPNSRESLKNYCLRKLGHPVLEINVDEDQIEDRIDEGLQYYQQFHSDAVVKTYRKHQITASDVTNKYVTIPDALMFVTRIFPFSNSATSGMFSINYQIHLNDIHDLRNAGMLSNYSIIKQYVDMLDMTINSAPTVEFNRHKNQLSIEGVTLVEDDYLIIEGYEALDPETYTDVYNDYFLKKYITSLIKFQWGTNLSKFEGMQLPGGVLISGDTIRGEAETEISNLEEEMRSTWEDPVDFYIG